MISHCWDDIKELGFFGMFVFKSFDNPWLLKLLRDDMQHEV